MQAEPQATPPRRGEAGWVVGLVLLAWAIPLAGSFWIGYVSDDFDLLQRFRAAPVWRPLQGHHFAPIVALLFHVASRLRLGPLVWHGLALAGHGLNVVLVWAISRRGFRLGRGPALAVTALFACSAAGYEALAWACSIGYVLVLPFMLLGLLRVMTGPAATSRATGMMLAGLQFGALALWDWGVLLFPLTCVALFVWRVPQGGVRWRDAVSMLWPCGVVAGLLVVLKIALGYQPGYDAALDRLALGAAIAAGAPLVTLVPNVTTAFLASPWRILPAAALWGGLVVSAARCPQVRSAAALYGVCLVPAVLFGALQSRYLYLAMPFFGVAVVGAVAHWMGRRPAAAACLLLVLGHGLFALQRSRLWTHAYLAAQDLRATIDRIPAAAGESLVIVNLPDSFGPPGLIWRPFVWRNGLSSFGRHVVRINTPGCPFVWKDAPLPLLAENEIRRVYPDARIYEVVDREPGDGRHFRLVPFTGTGGVQKE